MIYHVAPYELLSLKLNDNKFKVSSTGTQYAEVHILQNNTKPITLPLRFSIPYRQGLDRFSSYSKQS